MSRTYVVSVGLAAALSAGCGGAAHVTMQISQADTSGLDVTLLNTGDASTAPLKLMLTTSGVFFLDSEDCSDRALAPEERCTVRVGNPVSNDEQPDGLLAVDDGHSVHVSIPLVAIKTVPRLVIGQSSGTTVTEGQTADATLSMQNAGTGRSGPITLAFTAKVVADHCTGVTLAGYETCSFQVEYTAPYGQQLPVTLTGSASADPGGTVPAAVRFDIVGILNSSGPLFGYGEPAGATSFTQISNWDAMPVGPLQVSIENPSGNPAIDYPPFIIVAADDKCSGQTLSSTSKSTCSLTVALDPRLPAGGFWHATFVVRGGSELLRVPFSGGRGTP